MKPKISVIIPIYGTQKYLDECLLSVRKQSFSDIEIICVDDCSPDDSYLIVEKHAAKDTRVSLIRHETNLGLGGARNTAIRVAKAEYIASVDSDDYVKPDMLEILWDATENGWFDVVCCGFDSVDDYGNKLSSHSYPEKQLTNDNNELNIFNSLNPAFWNKLWRRSLFVDYDIYFPNHDYFEDMSTTPRILTKARYIKVIKNCLYLYRIRNTSIMNGVSDKHLIDYFKGFEIISEFLEDNNLSERYESEFKSYIKGNLVYYSKSILNSNIPIDRKKQYLRYLLLFRITFNENFKSYIRHDVNDLLIILGKDHLFGKYHDEYEESLGQLAEKEDNISQQLILIKQKETEIETKNSTISQLTKECSRTTSTLKIVDILAKDQEKKIHKLEDEVAIKRERVVILDNEVARNKEVIASLNKTLADEVSFVQMIFILIFALFARPTMNRKQTLKLLNKPKIFFKDSQSKLAKKYASFLGII